MTLIQFDDVSGGRIGDAVRYVESQANRRAALQFSQMQTSSSRRVFRVGTFTGSWSLNSLKVVTFQDQTSTPNTVVVRNMTMHLPDIGLAQPFVCNIAKDGTAWFLVSSLEHNIKRGTFSAPWSKGASKTVALVNGGSVTAVNRHADITGSGTKNCTVGRDGMDWELIAAEC